MAHIYLVALLDKANDMSVVDFEHVIASSKDEAILKVNFRTKSLLKQNHKIVAKPVADFTKIK